MKKIKGKELDDIYLYKKNFAKNIDIYKKKKFSIVSTLDTQNSQKHRERSSFVGNSSKELNEIKNNKNKDKKKNNNRKEIPSFKGSSFPIFLSSMTNSKNNVNLISNYKFKTKNNKISNSIDNNNNNNKSTSNYSILFNNSNLYNGKFEENGKSISIQSRNNHKKLDLKINFPKLKNMYNLKLISNRNIKKHLFNTSEDKNIFPSNINDLSTQNNNNNGNNSNIFNNYKFQNYSMDNDIEKCFQLNQKMKEINDFVNSNKPKKKIQNVIYKKINEKIISSKAMDIKKNVNIADNNINKNNNFNKNRNSKTKFQKSTKIIPKIIKNKSLFNENIFNISKSNKNLINISSKKNVFGNGNKMIINLKKSVNDSNIKIVSFNENNHKKAKKIRAIKKIEQRKHTLIMKQKLSQRKKIKFMKLIPSYEHNYNNNKIKNENKIFIKEVITHNDSKEKFKTLKKNIKENKIAMILKQKSNIDKMILKKKEKLKEFDLDKYSNLIEEKEVNEIYELKRRKFRKTYLEIKKKSILLILFFSYIYYFNKCGLDMNLLNYIVIHVEFSSIYLPIVKFKGQKEQMIITKKLFSYKKKETIFHDEKSKFIEIKKNKKKFQFFTINFITKEIFNTNKDLRNINNYSYNENIKLKKLKIEDRPSKKSIQNKLIPKKKSSYYRSNSYLFNKLKEKRNHLSKKNFKIEDPQKPLSLLQKKQFFKFSVKRKVNNNLRNSLINNLVFYKLSSNDNQQLGLNESKYYIQKILSIIRENKINNKINSTNVDFFDLLKKIKGKENIEVILRTLIKEGEINLFNEYIEKNLRTIDINNKDEDGNTFLIISIKERIYPIIQILLEMGIDVNIQNNEGNSALHYALSGKNFDIADALKKFGAKEDLYNNKGMTPWDCIGKAIENN